MQGMGFRVDWGGGGGGFVDPYLGKAVKIGAL